MRSLSTKRSDPRSTDYARELPAEGEVAKNTEVLRLRLRMTAIKKFSDVGEQAPGRGAVVVVYLVSHFVGASLADTSAQTTDVPKGRLSL